MLEKKCLALVLALCLPASILPGFPQDLLTGLGSQQQYKSKRVSSFDRTGGNADRLSIPPGATAVLAEIEGPGAIHHLWMTIDAEPFYGRKLVLRMCWDGETDPSVEVPIGDFFAVGHGLNRDVSSLPIANSSNGRARNCYWFMPFQRSARITVTNDGQKTVGAFYFYIDYRQMESLPPETPFFHSTYRQEAPCSPDQNYLILDAWGQGHYVGCCLSILQRALGWWGEGDDMIFIDGEKFPSLHGTGSEDYFSDAWGMREGKNLFFGCPLQEEDFKTGAKASVYRFHIPDPIPFRKSIRVTIEHGHANDRADFFSSVAYWYQSEPHRPLPPLPPVTERLPFAQETPENLVLPRWEETGQAASRTFLDILSGMTFSSEKCAQALSSFYNQAGDRYPMLLLEESESGTRAEICFAIEFEEQYDVDIYFLKGPRMGTFAIEWMGNPEKKTSVQVRETADGFSPMPGLDRITLHDLRLAPGKNRLFLEVTGKSSASGGTDLAFVGQSAYPSQRRFIHDWNLIGPFDAPDMSFLLKAYPPEKEIQLAKEYEGKDGSPVGWKTMSSEPQGFMRLEDKIHPPERGIIYGLVYVHSPQTYQTHMLIGSDDGVRIWINGSLVHTNPAYRGCYPDQDRFPVVLQAGWNTLLVKVLQGAGGWGFYARFIDPDGILRFATDPPDQTQNRSGKPGPRQNTRPFSMIGSVSGSVPDPRRQDGK